MRRCYETLSVILLPFALAIGLYAQQQAPTPSSQPKVKVNMLNVCSPSLQEQQEIASALAKVPRHPLFGSDFEVDRGRTTLDAGPDFLKAGANAKMSSADPGTASWVRIRREFSFQALFASVQYSFSLDPKNMMETLVFRVRDPKDLMQLSIEDSASAVTSPAAMLGTNTPATHVKLERFGKSSVVLARSAWPRRGARHPISLPTSRCFRALPRWFRTIASCWTRSSLFPRNWLAPKVALRRGTRKAAAPPKKGTARKR